MSKIKIGKNWFKEWLENWKKT